MENTRSSYAEELKWNVKDLYASSDDYERDYAYVQEAQAEYKKYEGHVLDDAETLCKLLEFDTMMSQKMDRIYVYSHIQNDQDTRDTKYQVLYDRAVRLYESLGEASSFIVPELMKSDYSVVEGFIKKNEKLKPYERMLKDIYKMKNHILSDAEEKLLSGLSSAFGTPEEVFSFLTDADMKFGEIEGEDGTPVELTEKTYHKLIISPNREVRKHAFLRLLEVYSNFKNTYAKLLASEVNQNNKFARMRGYDSALEASLYGNDIPVSIVENLIATVKKNVAPLSKYWTIKRDVLGVDELHIYDTYAPTSKSVNRTFTFDEAKELIIKVLEVLGSDYISVLRRAFSEGWIDSPANDGKRNGAYCTKCYGVHPYVLVSFDGTLNSVSTLAHELGHAMHDYYAITNQSYQDHGYSIFVAEVASQVNQIILSKYLIEHSKSKEEKIYLLDDLIQDFKSTIYRQTMFADFEKTVHEKSQDGESLTYEVLNDLYYKLNLDYYGENIVVDEAIKYEWQRIPHFYMNFYVYQYATAYAAAIIIAKNILEGKQGAVESYLEFLKLGCTKTPVESLKVAGVDMESEKVLAEAFEYFDGLISELQENMR